jgi:tryptophanyl-tRNA synthetase
LSDSAEEIEKKIKTAITDPARIRRDDPGNPDICLIYDYHKLYSRPEEVARVNQDCRSAKLGCVEDKKRMAMIINDFLEPIRQKRQELMKKPELIDQVIETGTAKATAVARQTMAKVIQAMGL